MTCSLLLCAYFISQCRNKFNLFDTFCIHSRNVFIHFLFSMSIFNPMGPKRKNFFFILICANKRNQIYFYFHLKVKYSEYCLENNFSSITKYDWMLLKRKNMYVILLGKNMLHQFSISFWCYGLFKNIQKQFLWISSHVFI